MIRPALTLLFLFTLLTGAAYPALVTGVAQLAFPVQANGDPSLVGRAVSEPRDFFGRPSATTPPYNAAASSGSNLGPLNPALAQAVAARVKALQELDPGNTTPIPVELVTASASGLDPHLSPQGALYQVPRVARLRGLTEAEVRALVDRETEDRTFGLLGEPRVNVQRLNLALDALERSGVHDPAATAP